MGEDAESLVEWNRRRFGDGVGTKVEDAAFHCEPLLPAAYPETASDLRALAPGTGAPTLPH